MFIQDQVKDLSSNALPRPDQQLSDQATKIENAFKCLTTTEKDREKLAELCILKRRSEELVAELKEKLSEAKDINSPDANTERMWKNNQKKMEQLEEKFDQISISMISRPSSDSATEQRLQHELRQINHLRTLSSQLYREGERLCTGKISSRANYGSLKFCTLLNIKLEVYSAPHLFEYIEDVKARFQKNPVDADSQFDFVLSNLRKSNESQMSYLEATYRPRSLAELERVLVVNYGQPTKLEKLYTKQLQMIGRCPWPIRAENAQSIYRLLHATISVVLSAESCVSYFRQTQGENMAEKTLSQGLHTNSFLSALLNVLDPEMAASLAPQLDSQTISYKFDVIVAGIRQRLKVADVMLNQLEISSHPTTNQRVLFAAPSHLDGDSSGTAYHDDSQNQNTRICVA